MLDKWVWVAGLGWGGFRSKASNFFAVPGRKKKAAIGGGLTAGVVTAVVGISSFVSGPMQLVHLSEILQGNFSGQEDATKSRTGKLLKYWRTGGDVGHTRLGMLGSKHFKKTMTQLSDMGIEFQDNRASHLKSATYDTNKLQKKYPELKEMSQDQQRKFLSKKLGLPPDKLERVGGKFAVNMRDMDIKSMRLLGQNSFAMLEDGKVSTGLKFRVFSQYFDIPSMWHPLKRAEAKVGNKISTAADRKKADEDRKKAEEERQKKLKPAPSPEAQTAKSTLKEKMGGLSAKSFGAGLMIAGTVCTIRDIADAAVIVNRAEIVLPSATQAADKIAVGAQVKSNQDIDAGTVGEVVKSFKDKETGQTIWQGKALQATANPSNAAGEDLDAKYGQAFSGDTTAANIKKEIDDKSPPRMCSPEGKLLQLVGGLALLVAAVPSGGSSIAAFAGAQAAQTAAFMGIMVLFQQAFTALITDDAVLPAVMSGAQGGNLIAYGAREFSNMGARADGGVELSQEESLAIDLEAQQKSKEEFAQKGTLAKVFDPYDYRTPAGQFASSMSPDIGTNVATLGQSLLNFGSTIPQSFAKLLPVASAADEIYYDWPFPRYGIPKEILNDPVFDDPYDNGDRVADLLDSDAGQDYVDKATKCFGVSISKDGEEWTVSGEGDVDPNSDEYNGAGCGDLSDTNWKRVMLFVFDTRTMLSIACYDGNNDACTELGVATTSGSSGSSGEVSGDAQSLAQQILDNPDIDIDEGNFCRYCRQDIQNIADGKPAYGNVTIDINLLKFLVDLGNRTPINVNSITGEGSGHSSGSNHYSGKAVDFECGFNEKIADEVGKKYGYMANNERCDNGVNHSHYSPDGY